MIYFGPSELGPVATAIKRLEEYFSLGLRACEIAFTYGVYIKEKDTFKIRKRAGELGIKLSIHAPYYLNLNSEDPKKIEATKKRILDCCRIGEMLGARRVVFHPGYYGKKRDEAYSKIKQGILEIMAEIKKNGWKIEIAPETMGKTNVFGSLEEIKSLVKDTGCSFCLDFAHILARDKKIDYEIIKKMFREKEWHCHFSGIVYGEKGEKYHKTTTKEDWQNLLNNLPKEKEIVIINESPTNIEDCLQALKILKN